MRHPAARVLKYAHLCWPNEMYNNGGGGLLGETAKKENNREKNMAWSSNIPHMVDGQPLKLYQVA